MRAVAVASASAGAIIACALLIVLWEGDREASALLEKADVKDNRQAKKAAILIHTSRLAEKHDDTGSCIID